jgi:hypothetical protein
MRGSRDRVHGDLGDMGPMRFVREYRRRGWRNGGLAAVMAEAGVSAGKIHEALAQPLERGSQQHMAQAKPDYAEMALAQEEEEQRERDLPAEEQRALTDRRVAGAQTRLPVPLGEQPSPLTQAGAVAEQVGWGTLQGVTDTAYDVLILMNSLRAPAVRRELRYLDQFPPDSPEGKRAEALRWDLPETWAALKEQARAGIGRAADARLTPERTAGMGRVYAEIGRDAGREVVAPVLMAEATAGLSTPDKLVSTGVEEQLLKAQWMQPLLQEALRKGGPGADRALARATANAILSLPEPVLAGEKDLRKLANRAITKGLKGARSGYAAGRRESAKETKGER